MKKTWMVASMLLAMMGCVTGSYDEAGAAPDEVAGSAEDLRNCMPEIDVVYLCDDVETESELVFEGGFDDCSAFPAPLECDFAGQGEVAYGGSDPTNAAAEVDVANVVVQEITGLIPGATYTLSVDATGRSRSCPVMDANPNVDVSFTNTDLGTQTFSRPNGVFDWTTETYTFTATDTSGELRFEGGDRNLYPCGLLVDNISVVGTASNACESCDIQITSSKGLSNIVIRTADGDARIESFDSEYTHTIPAAGVEAFWVKSGCNKSGDGPGYGERFEGPMATVGYPDADGDGFGAGDAEVFCDGLPDGYVENGSDCDDDNASAYPGGVMTVDVILTADDQWRAWIDGVEYGAPNSLGWSIADTLTVELAACEDHSLAIYTTDVARVISATNAAVYADGALINTTSDDGSWKTTRSDPGAGWEARVFDSSSWPDSVACTRNPWGTRPTELSGVSSWIGTDATCAPNFAPLWNRTTFSL